MISVFLTLLPLSGFLSRDVLERPHSLCTSFRLRNQDFRISGFSDLGEALVLWGADSLLSVLMLIGKAAARAERTSVRVCFRSETSSRHPFCALFRHPEAVCTTRSNTASYPYNRRTDMPCVEHSLNLCPENSWLAGPRLLRTRTAAGAAPPPPERNSQKLFLPRSSLYLLLDRYTTCTSVRTRHADRE